MHGFLGPNGVGQVDDHPGAARAAARRRGHRRLLGGDPWRDAVALHRRLAYVPGDVNLWPNLTGGEAIDLLGRLRGGLDPRRRAELLERFELDPTKKGRSLLQGQPAEGRAGGRAGLGRRAAAARRADLGLDPLMEAVFRECVAEVRGAGRTVLLSSHILAEVEALCDRVSIIRAGRTVETGTLAELRHLTRTSVAAELDRPAGRPGRAAGRARPRASTATRSRCEVDTAALDAVLRRLTAAGVRSLVAAADAGGAVPAALRRRCSTAAPRRRRCRA